jgi:hypothetical protein
LIVALAGSVAHVRGDRVVLLDRPGQPVLHPVRITSPGKLIERPDDNHQPEAA